MITPQIHIINLRINIPTVYYPIVNIFTVLNDDLLLHIGQVKGSQKLSFFVKYFQQVSILQFPYLSEFLISDLLTDQAMLALLKFLVAYIECLQHCVTFYHLYVTLLSLCTCVWFFSYIPLLLVKINYTLGKISLQGFITKLIAEVLLTLFFA